MHFFRHGESPIANIRCKDRVEKRNWCSYSSRQHHSYKAESQIADMPIGVTILGVAGGSGQCYNTWVSETEQIKARYPLRLSEYLAISFYSQLKCDGRPLY